MSCARERAAYSGKERHKGRREKESERERDTRTTHRTLYCPINSNLLPVPEKDKEGTNVHEVESSPNRDSIDAPVIARTANPDATRNSLNRLSRPRGENLPSWRL